MRKPKKKLVERSPTPSQDKIYGMFPAEELPNIEVDYDEESLLREFENNVSLNPTQSFQSEIEYITEILVPDAIPEEEMLYEFSQILVADQSHLDPPSPIDQSQANCSSSVQDDPVPQEQLLSSLTDYATHTAPNHSHMPSTSSQFYGVSPQSSSSFSFYDFITSPQPLQLSIPSLLTGSQPSSDLSASINSTRELPLSASSLLPVINGLNAPVPSGFHSWSPSTQHQFVICLLRNAGLPEANAILFLNRYLRMATGGNQASSSTAAVTTTPPNSTQVSPSDQTSTSSEDGTERQVKKTVRKRKNGNHEYNGPSPPKK